MALQKIIALTGLFFCITPCAQGAVTIVGLVDKDNSFVRVISPSDVGCTPIEVQKNIGAFYKLNLNKKKFNEATICETVLSPEIKKIKSTDGVIEAPKELKRVAFIGDTGCRLKNSILGGPIQKCENENEWPFKTITHSIVRENADLVIHLGDYHYRESCKDKAKCAPYEGTVNYDYKAWEADFLAPASELLQKIPFILVRGNHEDCHRAFLGYYKLINPIKDNDRCLDAEPTRYLKFGNLLIVNFDASNVDDSPNGRATDTYRELKTRFAEMVKTINESSEKEVWIVTHKPIWGLAPFHSLIVPVNLNLQNIANEIPLPKKVTMVFGGHIHNFQLGRGNHPLQLVVGESGTELDPLPQKPNNKYNFENGVEIFSPITKNNQFGYLLLEKNANEQWVAYLKDTLGKTEYTCQLWDIKSSCIKSF